MAELMCWRVSFSLRRRSRGGLQALSGATDAHSEAQGQSHRQRNSLPHLPRRLRLGITFRNLVTRLMRLPFVLEFVLGRELRDKIELPDFGF